MNPARRRHLLALAAATAPALARVLPTAQAAPAGDPVRRGRPWQWPRDHGAHLGARTEWWYVTGWLGPAQAPSHGFQVTFFRSRTGLADTLPGRLAPRQLLLAHAAVTELASGRHRHAQRLQRWNGEAVAGGQAGASQADTEVWIGPWSLRRETPGAGSTYRSHIRAGQDEQAWSLALTLRPTQPLLLQGDAGFSRKGPAEQHASHYYSLPQLAASAELQLQPGAAPLRAEGRAWLDHEWSDEILAPGTVGWDWMGINGLDGSALTAFRLRRADGSTVWAGGSQRNAAGRLVVFSPDSVHWQPGRRWRSPATGALYPVEWQVQTPAGRHTLHTLLDNQELDGRLSSGTVYWEGLAELRDEQGRRAGLGYLEMTGYAGALRL